MVRRLETFFHHWWNLMNYQKSVKNSPLVSAGPWFHPLGEGCLTQGHGKKLSSSFLAPSPFSCLWVGKQQKWRVKSAETITQPPAHHGGVPPLVGWAPTLLSTQCTNRASIQKAWTKKNSIIHALPLRKHWVIRDQKCYDRSQTSPGKLPVGG